MAEAAKPRNMYVLYGGFIFLKKNLYKLLVTLSHNAANTDLLPTVNFPIFCFNTGWGDKGSSGCLGPSLLTLTEKGDNSAPYKFAKECQQPKESSVIPSISCSWIFFFNNDHICNLSGMHNDQPASKLRFAASR